MLNITNILAILNTPITWKKMRRIALYGACGCALYYCYKNYNDLLDFKVTVSFILIDTKDKNKVNNNTNTN